MAPIIQFRDVGKTFDGGSNTVTALEHVNLDIEAGEIFGVIGYSGAGKSTLVRLINALEPVSSGQLLVDGQDITKLGGRSLRELRANIGMVFQQFNLLRSRTVFGNVAYPLSIAGWDKQARRDRVEELLNFVGIVDKAWHYPDQLSGGQKQRVGIARALATNPKILLADESTSALDPETTGEVLRLLKRVNAELGVTIVVITHEMTVVRELADSVAVLDSGKVIEHGDAYEVFAEPKTETTRTFVETVVQRRPRAPELERLRERHPGRLVTARVTEEGGLGGALSAAVSKYDVSFEIVYGGIQALGGRSLGGLTLELRGETTQVDALIAELASTTEIEEIHA